MVLKDTVEWSNVELERSVRAMEANVIALESGNPEADDSEMKQKYDNQKQLNVQLQEQGRNSVMSGDSPLGYEVS